MHARNEGSGAGCFGRRESAAAAGGRRWSAAARSGLAARAGRDRKVAGGWVVDREGVDGCGGFGCLLGSFLCCDVVVKLKTLIFACNI